MAQIMEKTQAYENESLAELRTEVGQLRAEVQALREVMTQMQQNWRTAQRPTQRTEYPHVIRIQGVRGGSPLLAESYISIKTIIEFIKQGFSPEKIVEEYVDELTLAQVYEALAYYYRHQAEIDMYLKADEEAGQELHYISAEQVTRRQGAMS